jgi:hypothetical protein
MPSLESQRYTLAGPDEVERRIAADQRLVVDGVQALLAPIHLRALVLAGGYGRGEGGYRTHDGVTIPYNDYDYFVVVQGLGAAERDRLSRNLHVLAERLSGEMHLEVDFAVLATERLSRLPSCLMYSELKTGHRVLVGDPRALDAIASPPAEELPLAEFSRMMLNRGALLLMNAQALLDAGVVRTRSSERFLRYFSKGLLAAGDARLAAAGRYHPSMAERSRRLQELPWDGEGRERFLGLYRQALQVKLGGAQERVLGPGEPYRLHRLAVHEWLLAYRTLESARLGMMPSSWQAYASPGVTKGQGDRHWWSPLRHVALALRRPAAVRRSAFNVQRLLRHPRERLMAALPLLLESGTPGQNRLAAEALGAAVDVQWPGLADLFLSDWQRYC